MIDEHIIESFHAMWDSFPGIARLIGREHQIIASNKKAEDAGFIRGCCCAKIGKPEIHKGCLAHRMFQTMEAQLDCPSEGKVRGWVPVQGHDDLSVHFTLIVPEK